MWRGLTSNLSYHKTSPASYCAIFGVSDIADILVPCKVSGSFPYSDWSRTTRLRLKIPICRFAEMRVTPVHDLPENLGAGLQCLDTLHISNGNGSWRKLGLNPSNSSEVCQRTFLAWLVRISHCFLVSGAGVYISSCPSIQSTSLHMQS